MKKKEAPKILVKVLCFVLIMGISLVICNRIFLYKDGTEKFKDFYTEEQQFDILFFGSSRVLEGIQPMELWEDYGIRSYNMAQHGESLGRDYWQLKNALNTHVPRLVVMDISAFYSLYEIDPSDDNQVGTLHKQIDHIPLSVTKLQTIRELCPSGTRAEFVFPFIKYHSRWNELSSYDLTYKKYPNSRKGAEVNYDFMPLERPVWDDSVMEEDFPFENTKITEILEVCEEYGTSVLFINVPYAFGEERMPMISWLSDYLERNEIPFVNYQRDEDFLDYRIDFGDQYHLNAAGSLKLTSAIGRYFVDNYGVSETEPKVADEWNSVLALYKENKDSYVMSAERYEHLLMLTYADNDYDVKVLTSPERMEYTGTNFFFPDARGIEGYEGYRIEIYHAGDSEPMRVWEAD
jgi:hypothetical protein